VFRDRFVIPDDSLVYLDGNSLGRLPKAAAERVRHLVEREWGDRLIRGWNEGWIELSQRIGGKLARLMNVDADEVRVCDSTSANFFKLAWAALEVQSPRPWVVTELENFPSDLYLLQGIHRIGMSIEIAMIDHPERVAPAIHEDVALVSLSQTAFKSGHTHSIAEIDAVTHANGAFTLWDLSHSIGALPTDLSTSDMAVGCGYKYLNGGPGAPAFLYVRRELQDRLLNPIQGWFGARDAFEFGTEYAPAAGIDRFLVGTPPVISMAAMEAGIDLILEAGIERIRERSLALTDRMIDRFDVELADLGFELRSPRSHALRGSHLVFAHPEAWRINRALIEIENVIGDFRAPDMVRFGVAPLYNDSSDVDRAMEALARTVRTESYRQFPEARPKVT